MTARQRRSAACCASSAAPAGRLAVRTRRTGSIGLNHRTALTPERKTYRSSKSKKKAARRRPFDFMSNRSGGDSLGALAAAVAEHEAHETEAQDHHRPGRGFRNARDGRGDVVEFKGRFCRVEHHAV